jgi:para-nitrobenzyl esterase
MQVGVSMPGEPSPSVSEDCLYLNIWAPASRSDQALPVMVWIYGGGFSNGSTALPLYAGDGLAHKGVVVVSMAYRVGPFGLLAHPELTAESPRNTSGNSGLMDQVIALQWVRDNIGAFGGDPSNVTVFGQSAGATSISILMASPQADGLFHRAIGQSGGLFEPLQLAPNWLLKNAEQEGLNYASSLDVQSLSELRELPAQRLLEGMAGAIAHPVIDSYFLPEAPFEVFSSGRQPAIPLLVGSNANEARSLTDVRNVTAENYAEGISARWGALPPQLIDAYRYQTDEDARQARLDFERDLRFGWDIWAWARLHSLTGSPDVYYYYFSHEPPFPSGTPYEGWGASHFAELWYVFGKLSQEPWAWQPADYELSEAVMTYWTNFARTGNPNGPDLIDWPQYSDDQTVLQLAVPSTVIDTPNVDTLAIFDSVYSAIRGETVSSESGSGQ